MHACPPGGIRLTAVNSEDKDRTRGCSCGGASILSGSVFGISCDLVGIYILVDESDVLRYTCVEWTFEQFLTTTFSAAHCKDLGGVFFFALCIRFTWLVWVWGFMHSFPIKYMDILPQDLLVCDIRHPDINDTHKSRIYVNDFCSRGFYLFCGRQRDRYLDAILLRPIRRRLFHGLRLRGNASYHSRCFLVPIGLENIPFWDTLMCSRTGSDATPRPYHLKVPEVCL
jgi:hypothetical protein